MSEEELNEGNDVVHDDDHETGVAGDGPKTFMNCKSLLAPKKKKKTKYEDDEIIQGDDGWSLIVQQGSLVPAAAYNRDQVGQETNLFQLDYLVSGHQLEVVIDSGSSTKDSAGGTRSSTTN